MGAQAVDGITTAYMTATTAVAATGVAAAAAPELAGAAINNRYIRIGEGKFPEPFSKRISIGNTQGSKIEVGMSRSGRIDIKFGANRYTIKEPNSCPMPKK